MIEIESKILKLISEAIKSNELCRKHLDILHTLPPEEFCELIDLAEDQRQFMYILKMYFTVYDESIVNEAANIHKNEYINRVIANCWYLESITASPEKVVEACVGKSLLSGDLANRIRSGFEGDKRKITEFDEQITAIINFLYEKLNNEGSFYKYLSGGAIQASDDEFNTEYDGYVVNMYKGYYKAVQMARVLYITMKFDLKENKTPAENNKYQKLKAKIDKWGDIDYEKVSFLNEKYLNYFRNKNQIAPENKLDANDTVEKGGESKKELYNSLYQRAPSESPAMTDTLSVIKKFISKIRAKKRSKEGELGEIRIENRSNHNAGQVMFIVVSVLLVGALLIKFIGFDKQTETIDKESAERAIERSESTVEDHINLPDGIKNKVHILED